MAGPNVSFDVSNPQSTNMSSSRAEQVNQMIQVAQLLYGIGHSIGQQHQQNKYLQDLGVLKPANQLDKNKIQPKPQDYMAAIKALGLNAQAPTQGTPDQQSQILNQFLQRKNAMAQKIGNQQPVPMPQPTVDPNGDKTMSLDVDSFKQLGGSLDNGNITLQPQKQDPFSVWMNKQIAQNTGNVNTPSGTVNVPGLIKKQPLTTDQKESVIYDRVMKSSPTDPNGAVDYNVIKDFANGKITTDEFNKFVGGMGIESRAWAKAAMVKAKEINPYFNESMMQNDQARISSGIKNLGRQQALAGQMVDRVDNFANIALQYSGKVNRTNYPILNKIDYLWNTDVVQDPKVTPDIKGLISSVKILSTDWARSTTGQTGGAAVTDSAREHFKDLINAIDNPKVFQSQVNLAKTDTRATKDGYAQEQNELLSTFNQNYGGIQNVNQNQINSVLQAKGGQQGNTVKVKHPNGQIGSIPSNQLQDALSQGYTQVQ